MSHKRSCVMPLACWDYSVEEQRPHTLFEEVGVMAHLPWYPATLGGLASLMCGPGPPS
jgi:hypothetical protein